MKTTSSNIKHNSVSLETKLKIIDEIDKRRSYRSVAVEYGISKSCVAGIYRNRDFINQLRPVKNELNLKRKRLRLSKYPNLEMALLAWVKIVRSIDDFTLTGPLLAEKAISLAKDLNISDFKASEGWLARFKERNALKFRNSKTEEKIKAKNNNLLEMSKTCKNVNDDKSSNTVFRDSIQRTVEGVIDFNSFNDTLTEVYNSSSFEETSAFENILDCQDNTTLEHGSLSVDNNEIIDKKAIPKLKDAKNALIILRRYLITLSSKESLPPLENLEIIEKFINSCQR